MKHTGRFFTALILTSVLLLAWAGNSREVHALQATTTPALNPTPLPSNFQPSLAPTATIDPVSIGDTTGVIALVIIVVAVILVGVLWGNHVFRLEAQKTRTPKD